MGSYVHRLLDLSYTHVVRSIADLLLIICILSFPKICFITIFIIEYVQRYVFCENIVCFSHAIVTAEISFG